MIQKGEKSEKVLLGTTPTLALSDRDTCTAGLPEAETRRQRGSKMDWTCMLLFPRTL